MEKTDLVKVNCNLCGEDKTRPLYNRSLPYLISRESIYNITTDRFGAYGQVVQCLHCSFVYQNPRISNYDILQGYSDTKDDEYLSQEDNRAINAHISLQTIKRYKSNGRFLDVGCATGILLDAARFTFEAHGVELSQWAVSCAKNKLKLDVQEGTLDTVQFPEEHFDVVSMVDVIEHVSDPAKTLEIITKILKPDGLLYIVTPNITSPSARLLGRYWWGLRPAHLTYFSYKTMTTLLEKKGFEILSCRSYGRIFTYDYWLSRLKNYPQIIFRLVKLCIDIFGVNNKIVFINTRDSMEICAKKK